VLECLLLTPERTAAGSMLWERTEGAMAAKGEDREILIVDEENRECGAATRARMHLEKLVHRAVHGVVHDEQGRVYLSQRDDVVGRDLFDVSVTEHVWPGETFEQTARRALALRLGLPTAKPCAVSEVFRDYDVHDGGSEYDGEPIVDDRFMQIYVAQADGEIVLDRRVYKAGEWRLATEIDALIESDPARFIPHFIKDWILVRDRVMEIVRRATR